CWSGWARACSTTTRQPSATTRPTGSHCCAGCGRPEGAHAVKELILLRHAHAEPTAPDGIDLDRPLSPEGLAEAEAAGRWLKEQGLGPDRVLSSPARGTRETVEAVLGVIGY